MIPYRGGPPVREPEIVPATSDAIRLAGQFDPGRKLPAENDLPPGVDLIPDLCGEFGGAAGKGQYGEALDYEDGTCPRRGLTQRCGAEQSRNQQAPRLP